MSSWSPDPRTFAVPRGALAARRDWVWRRFPAKRAEIAARRLPALTPGSSGRAVHSLPRVMAALLVRRPMNKTSFIRTIRSRGIPDSLDWPAVHDLEAILVVTRGSQNVRAVQGL
jgi:hypothetical protein